MKITGLDIGEYRQFKNIKFDFIYPEGHPKAGEPMDKVCFIGQSGTGKTTLLNIIRDYFRVLNVGYLASSNKSNIKFSKESFDTFRSVSVSAFYESINLKLDSTLFDIDLDNDFANIREPYYGYHWVKNNNIYENLRIDKKGGSLCVYLDEAIVNLSKDLVEERDNSKRELVSIKSDDPFADLPLIESIIIDLSLYSADFLWSVLLRDIDIYDNNLKQFAAELVNNNAFTAHRLTQRISEWQSAHPNPRVNLANNCLNQILKYFYLEVDVEGTESRVVLKTKKGSNVSGRYLSTGTKQLLTSSIPIYKSNVQKGVILFDEPERSLFPDIQRVLINHYTSLAPEAQFFFSTHSPIIASAFEPCERFILYFDENGEVKYRNGVTPIGDDPNDILHADFGLQELMLDEGLDAYKKYRQLGSLIRQETDEKKKNELIAERVELGNRYNF